MEHANAIELRSGKVLDELQKKSQTEIPIVVDDEKKKEEEEQVSKEAEKPKSKLFPDNPPPYIPPIPYPQRFRKQKLDKQFSKFLDIFKKLHINIPFADALAQMPSYVKFMKQILSNKTKLEDYETVALTEECSAILQKKLPPKLKDPGSFTIPCTIGDSYFDKALCDLGASINLMPLSVFRKLGLGEARPTTVSLQLADRSIKYPRGIIEDVLVKVDKFIFPADFIVLDMEEDQEIPIILGRPFLATGRTLIDVQKGELTMRVQDEEVTFNVFKALKFPSEKDNCFRLDTIEGCTTQVFRVSHPIDPIEACLVGVQNSENQEIFSVCERDLEALSPIFISKPVEDLGVGTTKPKPSIESPPELTLKQLPSHLRYAFLGTASTLPIIISTSLSDEEEEKLLRVLRAHKTAIGWSIADIKGISPSLCMHKILMEDDFKPSIEHQRRLNPKMKEVVRAEVVKLLDASIIYPISNSSWLVWYKWYQRKVASLL